MWRLRVAIVKTSFKKAFFIFLKIEKTQVGLKLVFPASAGMNRSSNGGVKKK